MTFSFDKSGFFIDGQRDYLISGEFHYFRVPREDWERRMKLFLETGGNTVATYVPWIVHEPEEGKICFDDRPERDLTGFLQTARKMGLRVILRPGPYQYSELVNAGLPRWLLEKYPRIRAVDAKGNDLAPRAVSYLHPILLEKARKYFRRFAEVIAPFAGDPVVMLQLDNEAMGIHLWEGSPDYNPEAMGFGTEKGRYPAFLKKRYGDIAGVNAAYGTDFEDFGKADPRRLPEDRKDPGYCRSRRDYTDFYHHTVSEYLSVLRGWLREDGIDLPVCHNAANPRMMSRFKGITEDMGEDFLLGVDHYYNLNQTWPQNAPSPQVAIRDFTSLERLRILGMPPAVLEMTGGSLSDTPPILQEDLLAWYMMNAAFGMKGVNYYIFTGGPNFEDTGNTCDIYDYGAFVHADGTLNHTYEVLKKFHGYLRENARLLSGERCCSVAVGFEWTDQYAKDYALQGTDLSEDLVSEFTERGILHTLFCSEFAPTLRGMDEEPDPAIPLLLGTCSVMPERTQKKLIRFVKSGGKLLLLGALPELDENYAPCGILRDYLGVDRTVPPSKAPHVYARNGKTVYICKKIHGLSRCPEGCAPVLTDGDGKTLLGIEKKDGGILIWAGLTWNMQTFEQARLLEDALSYLGAKPAVRSENRNIMTSLWKDPESGRRTVFVMNLYSGKQSTRLTVLDGEGQTDPIQVDLGPMEVKALTL